MADKFLTAADLGQNDLGQNAEHAQFKTVLWDEVTDQPVVPQGSVGFRWGSQPGRWNLRLGAVNPLLSLQGHTSAEAVPAKAAARVTREFARNAERTGGRSMIAMGAGTNHWFHSDQIYRTFLSLLQLCGCQGVNGGGWAHYVGQEKVGTCGDRSSSTAVGFPPTPLNRAPADAAGAASASAGE